MKRRFVGETGEAEGRGKGAGGRRWPLLLLFCALTALLVWIGLRSFAPAEAPVGLQGRSAPAAGPGQAQPLLTNLAVPVGAVALDAGLIGGRVVDSAGAPLPGALVSLSEWWTRTRPNRLNADRGVARATADKDGRFVFQGLRREKYFVTATNDEGASRAMKVNLEEEREAYLEVTVEKASGLTGTVLDLGGGPVEGARISAMGAGGIIFEARTTAGGKYRLPMPQGGYLVTVTADGYASARKGVKLLPAQEDFTLIPGGLAAGKVVDSAGPLQLPIVVAAARRGENRPVATVSVREDGAFEMRGLEVGKYTLTATGVQSTGSLDVTIAPGTRVTDLLIRLRPAALIKGKVINRAQSPLPDASITVFDKNGRELMVVESDGGGHFQCALPPSTVPVLRVRAAGHSPLVSDVGPLPTAEGAVKTVLLVLEAQARITGAVIDRAGRPPAAAVVQGQVTGDTEAPALSVSVRPDGSFVLGVPAGKVRLFAFAEGEGRSEVQELELRPAEARVVKLSLNAADITIRGRVVDQTGAAVVGARVSWWEAAAPEISRTTSAEGGHFALGPLSRGEGKLRATVPARAGQPLLEGERPLVIAQDPQAEVVLTVAPSALGLQGIVRDENGGPVEEALIIIKGAKPAEPPVQVTSQPDGRWRASHLTGGIFRLETFKDGFEYQETRDVRPGRDDLVISLSRAAAGQETRRMQ